jgi:radical SAM superfamily enzyme YgiQ (UPF0313 family)
MKTIVLINSPKCFYDPLDVGTELEIDPSYPVGLLLISAAIKNTCRYNVHYVDANFYHFSLEKILSQIAVYQPDFIGMNITFPNMFVVKEITNQIKMRWPHIKIFIGGPAATLGYQYILQIVAVDFIVVGEGEETIVELLDCLSKNENHRKIKGIAFRDGPNDILTTGIRSPLDIDKIPFLDVSNIPMEIIKKSREITLFTSRGCQGCCSFCSTPVVWGNYKSIRNQSVERIFKEIENYQNNGFEFDSVHFLDDSFTNNWDNVEKFMKRFKKEYMSQNKSWRCLSRINSINDKKRLEELVDSGCRQVSVGVESGSQKILNQIGKGLRLSRVKEFFENSRGISLKKNAFFMIGFPNETKEEIQKTLNFIEESEFDEIAINIVIAYPGTRLYKEVYSDNSFVLPEFRELPIKANLNDDSIKRMQKYSTSSMVSLSQYLTIEELYAFRELAYKKFYANKQVLVTE